MTLALISPSKYDYLILLSSLGHEAFSPFPFIQDSKVKTPKQVYNIVFSGDQRHVDHAATYAQRLARDSWMPFMVLTLHHSLRESGVPDVQSGRIQHRIRSPDNTQYRSP